MSTKVIKYKLIFWNHKQKKYQKPGKHYIVEKVKNPVLSSIPWINSDYIWRQITIKIDGDLYTMGCQKLVKRKGIGGWFIDADKFSPEFDTIKEALKWVSDKIIKGTCGDGSGGYHIRIDQTPKKHEVWIN